MRFSIVTPSFRNSQWLRLCVASVADQEGVTAEHLVQDAGSDDGTLDWLLADPRVKAVVEKDDGMYDAINRGWRRATGEILAYLNCDEQYLPGTLKAVADLFAARPEVDVLLADAIVVDTHGDYICHRCGLVPVPSHLWYYFPVFTCAVFLRRRVVHELGVGFDTQWRALGDVFWFMELTRRRVRMAEMRRFTSVFTETGDNLCMKPSAFEEARIKTQMTPGWVKAIAPAITVYTQTRWLLRGAYTRKPFAYSLYALDSPDRRVLRHARKPTSLWRRELPS